MNKEIIKQKAIYQDQRIAEEFCNFQCEYCEGFCPSGYSLKTDKDGNLNVPKEWFEKMDALPSKVKKRFEKNRTMDNFYDVAFDVMNDTKKIVQSDILKISGGEITTNKNLINFVNKIHNNYLLVQILTNGLFLKKDEIKKYKDMGNITFQISLDGVTFEANYARTHNKNVTQKVIENIDYMLQIGLSVEINCVLTKYNTDKFLEFLEKYKDAKNFIIVPRQVRGKPKEILGFSKKQVSEFEKNICENYEKYKKILPPKQYLNRLIETMKTGEKKSNCYIPYYIISIDGYGNFEKCPCGLIEEKQANIIEGTVNEKEILISSNYNIKNDYENCKYCITQYEIINLFIDDEITEKELKKVPSLNNDAIIKNIREIKEKIKMRELKNILEEKYNLEIDKIEKNEESTDGNVYIIYGKEKKNVIKIYDNIEHTKSMCKLHSFLTSNEMFVPEIVHTIKDELYIEIPNDKYVVMYSFLQGKHLTWNKGQDGLDSDIISAIAKTIRKLHSITSGDNKFKLVKLPFEVDTQRNSVLHFDLTKHNIFNDKSFDKQVGLIDFDDAKYGASVCDLAIVVAILFFSKTNGVDIKSTYKLVDEYYGNDIELKNKEIHLLRDCAIKWIEYILDGNEFDTSTQESFEIRKELIKNYLKFD